MIRTASITINSESFGPRPARKAAGIAGVEGPLPGSLGIVSLVDGAGRG